MTAGIEANPTSETVADLLERLGSIEPERVRLRPAPGTATENDVLARDGGEKRLCELVDGALVEKVMGFYESILAALLIRFLGDYLSLHDLGVVLGADGTLRLAPGLVRIPDVAFISWSRFPGRKLPREPIPALAPDLAVEVLSKGNTEQEMARKLREYFAAGVRLVWYVDPESRTVKVYTDPDHLTVLTENETLDGGTLLPGFTLPVRQWFSEAGERRKN